MVGVSTGLLGFVYGAQVGQSPLAWALGSGLVGAVSGRVILALASRRPRTLLHNLLLGTAVGMVLGGLIGLPAVALGAMAGEVAALLVSVFNDQREQVNL